MAAASSLLLSLSVGAAAASAQSTAQAAVAAPLASTADTYVTSEAPRTAFGKSALLIASNRAGATRVGYLSFAVPSYTGSVIAEAHLVLTRTAHHLSGKVSAKSVKSSSWVESSMTAATAPATGSVLSSVTTNASTSTVSLAVTPAVHSGQHVTLAVTSSLTSGVAVFRSRQATVGTPRLVVTLKAAAAAAAPAPTAPKTSPIVFGASAGGLAGESGQTAFTRINTGFGGLGVVRWWPGGIPNWSRLPAFYTAGMPVIAEVDADPASVASGALDAQLIAMLKSAPTNRPIWVTLNHEFDNAVHQAGNSATLLASEVAAQAHFGKLHRLYSPPNVRNALVLMGISYVPGRAMDGHVWQDYWPADRSGIDDVGSDTYQRGLTDATADTAAKILGPVFTVAKSLGKPTVFAELGTRHELSDAARAKFLTASIALFRANNTLAVCYFESYRGNKGPWNVLTVSPAAAAVWRAAVVSS